MAARAAHELNNPLTGVIGYTEMLRETIDDEKAKRRIEQALEEAHRCRRIVDNLLNFTSRGDRQPAVHDLNKLVSDAMSLCSYQLSVYEIDLETKLTPDLPEVEICAQDFQRALLNLVSNAAEVLKNSDQMNRRIAVGTRIKDGQIQVVVEDNGPGIPDELQEKVFEPFFTTRDVGEGIGLGLSVAFAIAREHGGDLLLDSEEGKGAAFTISIPLPDEA
jgi:signal transduction histidine kinase